MREYFKLREQVRDGMWSWCYFEHEYGQNCPIWSLFLLIRCISDSLMQGNIRKLPYLHLGFLEQKLRWQLINKSCPGLQEDSQYRCRTSSRMDSCLFTLSLCSLTLWWHDCSSVCSRSSMAVASTCTIIVIKYSVQVKHRVIYIAV